MTSEAALLLLVIALGAVASPSLGRWFGVPAAVVEILFGIGVAAFDVAPPESVPYVRFLADLGFALFLFLAGMEVDAEDLRRDGGIRILGPTAAALGSFLLAGAACRHLGWSAWVALAIGATSVPLLLSVVREAGLLATRPGRRMVTVAAVGEVLTVGLVAVAETVDGTAVPAALLGLVRLMLLLGAVVIATRVLGLLRWWFPEGARRLLGAGEDSAETGVRVGFGLAFVMIAAAALAGVEPLLGAFVGGLMVAFSVDEKHGIEKKFGPMAYGFFVPVFFVDVGLRLDTTHLADLDRLPVVFGVILLMLVVKLVPNLGWLAVGRPPRLVLAMSLLLAAPLTLVIAIADLAGRLGAIDDATEATLIVAGMGASLVFPSFARRILSPG